MSATGSRRSIVRVALVLVLTLAAATAATPASSQPQFAAAKLDFRVKLHQTGPLFFPCPVGVPAQATWCIPWAGSGFVRGLGNVYVDYDWPGWLLGVGPPACPADLAKPLKTIGRLSVPGRGVTIFITFAEGARCLPFEGRWNELLLHEGKEFTITGGTGPPAFAAASGRGTRERQFVPGALGTETWTGTLELPGFAFDVTAPKLHGAASKTVRAQRGAKSARVSFKVTAIDGVDGALPVSCHPRSGGRFPLGKTIVRCAATDSSGNTATAGFTVTVKRR
ncbi:MAG TPA: HYR domain-containing protein [Gaiellaceae bacterium]|nr:HYR domain-containing protein [Gaiellaceae bacterium]